MASSVKPDYARLDRPEILNALFHPRPEWSQDKSSGQELAIPVEEGVLIGARSYVCGDKAPTLLFFHGNGEIVADYEEMGSVYNKMGINFLPVDYRGYGRSTGQPTISGMMEDCHRILEFVRRERRKQGHSGPLIVMGRSLGSASALEIARTSATAVDGLIVESGFAFSGPLLQLLGVNLEAIGFKERDGFDNISKIQTYDGPTLIIHAEYDHIIPFSDGQALYDASPAQEKTLLKIPGANHNDIMMRGFEAYMEAIHKFIGLVLAK